MNVLLLVPYSCQVSDFRELLRTATGDSQHVIAVNADIRGFSEFSEGVESVQAALYLQKLYGRMLDDYFGAATFFKPTGDGLLVIYAFESDDLQKASREVMRICLRLVNDFPRLCTKDPMLNFELPEKLGIGLARGAATRLIGVEGTVLDYSGRPLNLASRLMDLARPEGVVFDASFRPEVLTPAQKKRFQSREVYVRSVAESSPIVVYYMPGLTEISARHLKPLDRLEWKSRNLTHKLSELKNIGRQATNARLSLEPPPASAAVIEVLVTHPGLTARGTKHPTMKRTFTLAKDAWALHDVAGSSVIFINMRKFRGPTDRQRR